MARHQSSGAKFRFKIDRVLAELLNSVEPHDGEARAALFSRMEQIARSAYPQAQLAVFGSTGMHIDMCADI